MPLHLKLLFSFLMIIALVFGFVHIYFPLPHYSFERLHIFLFNLCTGGSILLYYTQGYKRVSGTVKLFFAGSLIYAFSAFFNQYAITLAVSVPLYFLVEKIRIQAFSWFPSDFFKKGAGNQKIPPGLFAVPVHGHCHGSGGDSQQ